eukprot:326255-Prymnesium_polylepis.1
MSRHRVRIGSSRVLQGRAGRGRGGRGWGRQGGSAEPPHDQSRYMRCANRCERRQNRATLSPGVWNVWPRLAASGR